MFSWKGGRQRRRSDEKLTGSVAEGRAAAVASLGALSPSRKKHFNVKVAILQSEERSSTSGSQSLLIFCLCGGALEEDG